ncbi:MAG: DinB family protein [Chitinophagaceae bacterium]|nr:MAG: DinB family protein [Chitinophagaceae bacterium]
MISRKTDLVASESFWAYINLVKEDDPVKGLQKNTKTFRKLLKKIPRKKINFSYAEGKWTVKEMLQHIIDAERVFVFRAMSFSRRDPNELPGFDENEWAIMSKAVKRKWDDLVDEFDFLRASSEFFFASLDDEQLLYQGVANGRPLNAAALAFVSAGHVQHHINILMERYLQDTDLAEKKKKKKKV